jgi:D-glycero-alpha-D-manno-heptose 1-phosphate guanylyltransferase
MLPPLSLQALVLAGGLGTRLRSVVGDVPKVLAPVAGRPFLEHVLADLDARGFRQVVLAVGFQGKRVVEHFGATFGRMRLEYSEEREPLGTGGAVRLGLEVARPGPCFVLNGDTWLDLDYAEMLKVHLSLEARVTMAVRAVTDVARYGALEIRDGRVVRFAEKGATGPGLINAGTYVLDRSLFAAQDLPPAFSLERDFLAPRIEALSPVAFATAGGFVDIGVPEDYARAQEMFAARASR